MDTELTGSSIKMTASFWATPVILGLLYTLVIALTCANMILHMLLTQFTQYGLRGNPIHVQTISQNILTHPNEILDKSVTSKIETRLFARTNSYDQPTLSPVFPINEHPHIQHLQKRSHSF
jgi:hypothetical protein